MTHSAELNRHTAFPNSDNTLGLVKQTHNPSKLG